MTEYIVLRADRDAGLTWHLEFDGTIKASSARRALTAANVGAGEYVAVPARSWKPFKVSIQQTTKVTIG